MEKFNVKVSEENNSIEFNTDSLKEIVKRLTRCQGYCSVRVNETNQQIYFGDVPYVIEKVKREIGLWAKLNRFKIVGGNS